MSWKIIAVDNYDRESHHYPDIAIIQGIQDEAKGVLAVKALNDCFPENAQYYYKLVPFDYSLRKFEP